jgi:hypothetical protein
MIHVPNFNDYLDKKSFEDKVTAAYQESISLICDAGAAMETALFALENHKGDPDLYMACMQFASETLKNFLDSHQEKKEEVNP